MDKLRRLIVGSVGVPLPVFVPSISSIRSLVQWTTYVDILASTPTRMFLLSAYDYHQATSDDQSAVRNSLDRAKANGSLVVLDSGGYEASWLHREWAQSDYASVAAEISPDILFTFDQPDIPAPDPYATALDDLTRDSDVAPDAVLVPIVHGGPKELPDAIGRLAVLDPPLIAVAERRLGRGIDRRCRTIAAIRDAISAQGRDVPLHLLGTGDPRSILAYAEAGADSFDAVDWSQFVIDPTIAELLPAPRLDWIRKPAVESSDDSFTIDLTLGNLRFYEDWMEKIRKDRSDGTHAMAKQWIPRDVEGLEGYSP
jgi:queuine/archaeosine tRNA-ribosyltransferase